MYTWPVQTAAFVAEIWERRWSRDGKESGTRRAVARGQARGRVGTAERQRGEGEAIRVAAHRGRPAGGGAGCPARPAPKRPRRYFQPRAVTAPRTRAGRAGLPTPGIGRPRF